MSPEAGRHKSALEIAHRGPASDKLKVLHKSEEGNGFSGTIQEFNSETPLALPPATLVVISRGWAGVVRDLTADRGQVISLLLPGDPVSDFETNIHGSSRIISLTKMEVISFAEPKTDGMFADAGCDRPTAITCPYEQIRSYVFDQVVRLGLLNAYERTGHLFLEIHERLRRVGLVTSGQFLVPISQEKIGKILGLSEAHVNRVLKQLRNDNFLYNGPGWVRLINHEALASRVYYSSAA